MHVFINLKDAINAMYPSNDGVEDENLLGLYPS